jgi:hypothetical protein
MTILELPCGGETHRIEILKDGTAVMLDHDEEMVRSFIAFGAAVPSCFVVQQRIDDAEKAYRSAREAWTIDAGRERTSTRRGETMSPDMKMAMRRTEAEMRSARSMTVEGRFAEAWSTADIHYRSMLAHCWPPYVRWRYYVNNLLMLQDVAGVFDVRVAK